MFDLSKFDVANAGRIAFSVGGRSLAPLEYFDPSCEPSTSFRGEFARWIATQPLDVLDWVLGIMPPSPCRISVLEHVNKLRECDLERKSLGLLGAVVGRAQARALFRHESATAKQAWRPRANAVEPVKRRVSRSLRFRILERDGFRCRYCGASPDVAQLHVDHVHPVSRGGSNDPHNLVTACAPCNLGKASRVIDRKTVER